MGAGTDPNVLLSGIYQLRDELSDLGKVVSTERLATIIPDALPVEKCLTIKMQAIRDPTLRLGEIENIMDKIFINYSERSSAPKRSQELYRKSRDTGRKSLLGEVLRRFAHVQIRL